MMIRYEGALYDNIYLVNGFKVRISKKYGKTTAVEDVEGLHATIFKAVWKDAKFRESESNVFERTDKGWILRRK